MKNQFKSLKSLNTIIIKNECHDNIVETIFARNHADYQEDFEINEDISDNEDNFFRNLIHRLHFYILTGALVSINST